MMFLLHIQYEKQVQRESDFVTLKPAIRSSYWILRLSPSSSFNRIKECTLSFRDIWKNDLSGENSILLL